MSTAVPSAPVVRPQELRGSRTVKLQSVGRCSGAESMGCRELGCETARRPMSEVLHGRGTHAMKSTGWGSERDESFSGIPRLNGCRERVREECCT